jgi:negative regulator of flagellin synthesis FlgM
MSIQGLSHHEAARTYLQNAAGTGASPAASSGTQAGKAGVTRRPDSVSLSDNARTLATARAAVQQAPDVRDAKVAAIKQRVEDGTYNVPAHVLAGKLLAAGNN